MRLTCDERDLGIRDSFQFVLFQLVLVKLSAVQKTVKLLWVAYLSLRVSLNKFGNAFLYTRDTYLR
jgi:hypothetical protein